MYRLGTFFVFLEHFCSIFYTLLGVTDPCKMGNRGGVWSKNLNGGKMYRFI